MYACMYVLVQRMGVSDALSGEDVLSYVCVYVCMCVCVTEAYGRK
jgi:hypothetical protein